MAIAEKICELQDQRGESNYRLAKILGVSQSSVANWREGKSKPMKIYIEKLAEHFGCTVDDLLKEETA